MSKRKANESDEKNIVKKFKNIHFSTSHYLTKVLSPGQLSA